MGWLIYIGTVTCALIALRLIWRLMRWLGSHGDWPGDTGGSL